MKKDDKIWIAQADENIFLLPSMANRHGLISGATGTGKTITLKVLAESFSSIGVPVFLADVKGDLSGMCQPGLDTEDMQKRIKRFGMDGFVYTSYPSRFWDIGGEHGLPIRVTIAEMGAPLLSRLLGLTDVQAGVLNVVFKIAADHDLLLVDLKDLGAMLRFVGNNRAEFTLTYGNVSAASIGAIQRALLTFENEGGEKFFGEPSLDIQDWIRTDADGRGYINIFNSVDLINTPTIYSSFLLWMLSNLFEKLPEVGDQDKPRMVFFFDEAHLLFNDMSKSLLQKIIQVVKLIRSKGVGVYFISQSPADIPDEVLAQLSNRIQHALRAYTPSEQKAVKVAASTFRQNPAFDTQEAIMQLGVGEALVSFLDRKGIPGMVERAFILPPQSRMGMADPAVVENVINSDEFDFKYRETLDRISAYEIITEASEELERQRIIEEEEAARRKEEEAAEKQRLKEEAAAEKQRLKEEAAAEKQRQQEEAARKKRLEQLERQMQREREAEEKRRERERQAAQKAAEKQAIAEQKAAEKRAAERRRFVEKTASTLLKSVLGRKRR